MPQRPGRLLRPAALGAAIALALIAGQSGGASAENPERDKNQPNTEISKEQRAQCEKLGKNTEAYRNCLRSSQKQSVECEKKAGQNQVARDCKNGSGAGGGLGSFFQSIFN